MTIDKVANRFSPEFAAARQLVIETHGRNWIKVVKAYRAETDASLEVAITALAEGRDLRWMPRDPDLD